ncbi:uncharacterized protein F4812DRAFT_422591 [Daldinia caldariorum]|uniref:uncharacterized protein n=1 Tax=Daldinia caldariorum TaxID=326644 RepID=UPI0020076FA7|nr:uncharacterized protein F4812DRAFT_422591 [Daldinia caldariorum]KAI1469279.1 hypothetical protein F4812DRAFT_422591 [Daldinia caldariorum]
MDQLSTKDIRRKPVPPVALQPSVPHTSDILDDLLDDYYLEPTGQPDPHHQHPLPTIQTKELELENTPAVPPPPPFPPPPPLPPLPPRQWSIPLVSSPSEISLNSNVSTPEATNSAHSIWKAAVNETIYFAGGLISHPFESTKHYSILRHSAGVVFYRGPSTSIAITVFADQPLPADRSFWLQRKGFSGNMGMAASALLRTQGNWIEVTPSFAALPSQIPQSDERAWQRDIKKFLKKAASHKHLSKQIVRETCVIRIPASAEDGYLRIVMCTGEGSKKTLCPSPVFRVASTSSDVSVMRGASLTTMPIELGLKVASVIGQNAVERFIGPARDLIEAQIEKYGPGVITQEAALMAYETFNEEEEEEDTFKPLQTEGVLEVPPQIVGPDSGPEKPYPIRFTGKIIQGTGRGRAETGIPTANLAGVPEDLLLRLSGVYIGWAAIRPLKLSDEISQPWHKALITVGPSPYAPPKVVSKNVVRVYMINDFGEARFVDANLKVVLMAFLRPVSTPNSTQLPAESTATIARDIDIAVASLSRENWQCDTTLRRVKSEMSIAEKCVDMQLKVQRRVDSVPLHLAGVRTASSELKDQVYGRGGLYIRR